MYEVEFEHFLSEGIALPGTNTLIEHLYANGVPMAICTNSTRQQFDDKTTKMFSNWRKMIPLVMTAGDDPEVKSGRNSSLYTSTIAGRWNKAASRSLSRKFKL